MFIKPFQEFFHLINAILLDFDDSDIITIVEVFLGAGAFIKDVKAVVDLFVEDEDGFGDGFLDLLGVFGLELADFGGVPFLKGDGKVIADIGPDWVHCSQHVEYHICKGNDSAVLIFLFF